MKSSLGNDLFYIKEIGPNGVHKDNKFSVWLIILAIVLLLFLLAAIGCVHGVFGFIVRLLGDDSRVTNLKPYHNQDISGTSTAILLPVYNEDVARVCEGLRATYESLERTGQLARFDFYILSDSTDPANWVAEEVAWEKLRRAGAQARMMLAQAAADHWEVPVSSVYASGGAILDGRGNRLTYGELAEAAARLPVPANVELKPASEFKLVGKAHKRVDTGIKVDGSAVYGIDVKLPGMLHASIEPPPVLGATLRSFDGSAAAKMPGVHRVLATASGVAYDVLNNVIFSGEQARGELRVLRILPHAERLHRLPGRQVPDAGRPVPAAAQQVPAVRREGDRLHQLGMAAESPPLGE